MPKRAPWRFSRLEPGPQTERRVMSGLTRNRARAYLRRVTNTYHFQADHLVLGAK